MKKTMLGALRPSVTKIQRGWVFCMIAALSVSHVAAQSTACDLDKSGATNVVDVNRAVGMALGTLPCTAQVEGPNVCTILTVQRVVNATLGQPCVTYNAGTNSVLLTWLPSPSSGVAGYNIYRRTSSTSVVKINTTPVAGTSYSDRTIVPGTTYYYSATSVDASGNESPRSTEAIIAIPAS